MSRKTKSVFAVIGLSVLTALMLTLELFSSINRHIDVCDDPTSGRFIHDEILRDQTCQD